MIWQGQDVSRSASISVTSSLILRNQSSPQQDRSADPDKQCVPRGRPGAPACGVRVAFEGFLDYHGREFIPTHVGGAVAIRRANAMGSSALGPCQRSDPAVTVAASTAPMIRIRTAD
jgi:hypothetical protein